MNGNLIICVSGLISKSRLKLENCSRLPLYGSFVALLAFAVSANTIPPLITTIGRDLNQSFGLFGVLISIQYVFFALASFTGGYLETKLTRGNVKLVSTGLFLLGGALFAASGFKSIALFLLWAAPFGFAGGLVETFSSVIISNRSTMDSSKLLVFSQVFYCLGAFLAPQMVGIFLSLNWSWQTIFQATGASITVLALVFVFFTAEKFTNLSAASSDKAASDSRQEPFKFKAEFILSALLLFLYVVAELASICWVPLFFEEKFSISPAISAWRSALLWAGFIAGRLFILLLPKKWTMEPTALTGVVGMLASCVFLHFMDDPTGATLLVFVLGFFAGPLWPVIVMLARRVGKNDTFTSGVIGCGALGAAAGPSLGSVFISKFSVDNIFLLVGAVCLVKLAALWFFYYLISPKAEKNVE